MHFLSNHPNHQKKSIFFRLIDKAILLSVNYFHTLNVQIVKNMLLDNLYPINFINYNINRKSQFFNQTSQENNINQFWILAGLLFYNITDNLKLI